MAVCYDKLCRMLIDKKLNRTELKQISGISFNVLARIGKEKSILMEYGQDIYKLMIVV